MRPRKTESQNINAVGYIRVSTEEQATNGISLGNQASRIKAYAKSQNWQLSRIYREKGESGKSIDRPVLSQLIKDIESGQIDVVLVYKVDRLTRRQKDLWHLLEDIFETHQVGFKSVSEPFDTTTAQGKAFLGMIGVFAQLERDTIAERTRDTLYNKKTNGEWVGRIPFGFRLNDNGFLEKEPEQQKIITRIKRYHRSGKSIRTISREFSLSVGTIYSLINDNNRSRNARYIGKL
jgi:site-specific DNA recombinase